MEFIAENLYSCCDSFKKLRWRHFDWFGKIPSFQIKGNDRFQTNAGAFVTLLYSLLIIGCLAFYISLVTDKSRPGIQTNIYENETETPINFVEDHVLVTWTVYRSDLLRTLTIEEFRENFTFVASKLSFHREDENLPFEVAWQPIPFVQCSEIQKQYDIDKYHIR